jgi:hypothetical protein
MTYRDQFPGNSIAAETRINKPNYLKPPVRAPRSPAIDGSLFINLYFGSDAGAARMMKNT